MPAHCPSPGTCPGLCRTAWAGAFGSTYVRILTTVEGELQWAQISFEIAIACFGDPTVDQHEKGPAKDEARDLQNIVGKPSPNPLHF